MGCSFSSTSFPDSLNYTAYAYSYAFDPAVATASFGIPGFLGSDPAVSCTYASGIVTPTLSYTDNAQKTATAVPCSPISVFPGPFSVMCPVPVANLTGLVRIAFSTKNSQGVFTTAGIYSYRFSVTTPGPQVLPTISTQTINSYYPVTVPTTAKTSTISPTVGCNSGKRHECQGELDEKPCHEDDLGQQLQSNYNAALRFCSSFTHTDGSQGEKRPPFISEEAAHAQIISACSCVFRTSSTSLVPHPFVQLTTSLRRVIFPTDIPQTHISTPACIALAHCPEIDQSTSTTTGNSGTSTSTSGTSTTVNTTAANSTNSTSGFTSTSTSSNNASVLGANTTIAATNTTTNATISNGPQFVGPFFTYSTSITSVTAIQAYTVTKLFTASQTGPCPSFTTITKFYVPTVTPYSATYTSTQQVYAPSETVTVFVAFCNKQGTTLSKVNYTYKYASAEACRADSVGRGYTYIGYNTLTGVCNFYIDDITTTFVEDSISGIIFYGSPCGSSVRPSGYLP